jgi:hypothetical protein
MNMKQTCKVNEIMSVCFVDENYEDCCRRRRVVEAYSRSFDDAFASLDGRRRHSTSMTFAVKPVRRPEQKYIIAPFGISTTTRTTLLSRPSSVIHVAASGASHLIHF